MAVAEEAELDVRRYLLGLWRRKVLMLLVVLVAVNVTLLLSLRQHRVYQAEAKVLLTPAMFGDRTGLQLDAALAVQTEIQILESEPVQALVVQELGPVGKVSAERVGQTLLISLKAQARVPTRAADTANAYAKAYVRFRGGLGSAPTGADVAQTDVGGPAPTAQLVSFATVPSTPVAPKPVRDSILAGVIGVIVAVGLATALEALDDSVKTKAELRKITDLPALGVIPESPGWDTASMRPEDVPAPAAEAFRGLRTSVQLLGVDRPIRSLHITSAGSGEGKTTVVANLAMVLAHTGQRVAVIDADLRRPRLHEVFGVPNHLGVTSVLAGEVPVLKAVLTVPGTENLALLTSGPLPPNPSELLASKKMAQLIFELSDQYEVVIIDSPPVLAVTDAIVLTTWAEATVVVCCSGRTKRKQLATTVELLRQADAPLVGTVLNRASAQEDLGSKYHAYYQQAGQVAADRLSAASTAAEENDLSGTVRAEQGRNGHSRQVSHEEKDQR